ncbi:hypothetical protein Q3G72_006324 [Acer saccharum]|nr:hypothetical protein Q3G72_006324 [Acer saccharum]
MPPPGTNIHQICAYVSVDACRTRSVPVCGSFDGDTRLGEDRLGFGWFQTLGSSCVATARRLSSDAVASRLAPSNRKRRRHDGGSAARG